MAYRGNSALPAEIQQRIESTFQQALTSAKAGSHREALLGCDFILKLDPDFEPARILAQRLRQAAGGEQGMAAEDLGRQLKTHFDQGQFQQVLELAGKHQELVTGNEQLRQLATQAQERLGMQQFLEKALAGARQALESGNLEKAEELLKKVHSLAPEDPRLAQLEQQIEAQRPAPAAPAPPPVPAEVPADPLADLAGDDGEWGIFEGAIEPPAQQGSAFAAGPPAEPEASTPDFSFGEEPDPLAAFDSEPSIPSPPPALPVEEPQDAGFGSLFGDDTSGADSELDAAFDELGSGELSTVGEGGPSAEPVEALDFSFDEASEGELEDDLDFAIGELGNEPSPPPIPGAEAAAPAAASGGGGDRISGLLDEGQAAFEAGDYQSAIDVWSRIFLIDIDNEEASRRIEKARSLKAETERQVEEILHEGLGAYEAGDLERARGPFEKVLELNPNHTVAQEYLARIEAGEGPAVAVPDAFETPPPIPDMPGTPEAGGSADEPVLSQEILVPPDPGAVEAPPPPPPTPTKKRKSSPRTLFLAISALSVLLLAALGWFLLNNWSRFFPNQGAESAATAPADQSPIDQARKLAEGGRTRLAISQLERVPSNSPYYEEAQKLILELQTPVAEEPEGDGVSAEAGDEGGQRGGLVGQARLALEAGRALEARRLLQQAAALEPLSEAEEPLRAEVEEALEPIATEVQLFEDSEWGLALPALWRMHVDDPQNQDVTRLLVDSYYNLGVRYLQRNDPQQASESFAEVLELDADDFEAQRHARFARVYQQRAPDLLYRIYVKYLPFR